MGDSGFCRISTNLTQQQYVRKHTHSQNSHSDGLSDDIAEEFVQYARYAPDEKNEREPLQALRCLEESEMTVAFPNVWIPYRIFLTMMVANTEGERSFSIMKLLKGARRASLKQEELGAFGRL